MLVCLPPTQQAQPLVQRGLRLAERLGSKLLVIHVARPGQYVPLPADGAKELQRAIQLARELGARVVIEEADDVAQAIIAVAAREHVTQIILGESTRPRWRQLFGGSVPQKVLGGTRDVDVHIVQRMEPAS